MSDMPDFSSVPPADGFDTLSEFATEVARLAALPLHEYERARKEAAKRLGVRVSMLDGQVKAMRPQEEGATGQGSPIELPEIELCDEPVDGAELISDLVAQIRRFIVLDVAAALAVALWIIFARAHDAAFHSPRCAVRSPVHRCGKSTLLRVIGMLTVRRIAASSVTASATFRMIEATKDVVLLIDEFDTVDPEKAGELRAVVNAGHCRLDAYVIRTVPVAGELVVRRFSCWAPTVVASNKALPVTWVDRSITIRMKRKPRDARVDRLRDDVDLGFDALARRVARWAADNLDALRGANPQLPAVLNDRQADNWRMLIAIADRAGGDWGERARKAAESLSVVDSQDDQAVGELLLSDLRDYFDQTGEDRAPSLHLVAHLGGLEGRPWAEYNRGGTITQNQLANLLRPFGISSQTIRVEVPPPLPPPYGTGVKEAKPTTATPKGYMRAVFEAAWNRYLSQDPPSTAATTPQATDPATFSHSAAATNDSDVAAPKRKKPKDTPTCGVVAAQNPPSSRKVDAKGKNGQSAATGAATEAHPESHTADHPRTRGAGVHDVAGEDVVSGSRRGGKVGLLDQPQHAGPDEGAGGGGNGAIRHSEGPGAAVSELRALCQRAAQSKGRDAVEAIFQRLWIRRLDGDLKPQQGQALRAAIEAMLAEPNGAVEACLQCGDPVRPGDMLPLNGGGHVHHRCADAYIAARDAPRNPSNSERSSRDDLEPVDA